MMFVTGRHIQLLALTVKQFIDFIPLLLFFIVYKPTVWSSISPAMS